MSLILLRVLYRYHHWARAPQPTVGHCQGEYLIPLSPLTHMQYLHPQDTFSRATWSYGIQVWSPHFHSPSKWVFFTVPLWETIHSTAHSLVFSGQCILCCFNSGATSMTKESFQHFIGANLLSFGILKSFEDTYTKLPSLKGVDCICLLAGCICFTLTANMLS
jgi:hypothetical protein